MADFAETELEMARRLVRDSEARIIRQREIVARLPAGTYLHDIARRMLDDLEVALWCYTSHLARIEDKGP